MESMLDRPEQELVLVVDDTPDNLLLMRELLEEQYRVRTAGSGPAGLRAAVEEPRPDLILLDVNMPGMDGYEVCRRLKADPLTRDIPLMFLTARADRDDEQQGLALGAVDYLGKPVSPPIVLARVRTHLQLKANADFLRDKSEYLELEVRRRTRQLQQLQDAVIEALATLGDLRDNPRSRHLPRIERYVRLLAEHLAAQRAFADELTPEAVDLLSKSALLHDIGKVAVPDRVLLNPGNWTPPTPPCYRAIPAPDATPWPAPSGGSASLPGSSASPGRSPTAITNAGMAGAFRKAWRASGFPWRRGSSPWPTATMN